MTCRIPRVASPAEWSVRGPGAQQEQPARWAVAVHSPSEPLGSTARGVCKTTPQGVWVGEEEQSQLWSLIQKAGYPGLGPSFAWRDPNPLLPPPFGAAMGCSWVAVISTLPAEAVPTQGPCKKHPDLSILPYLQVPEVALRTRSLWASRIPLWWRWWLNWTRVPAGALRPLQGDMSWQLGT